MYLHKITINVAHIVYHGKKGTTLCQGFYPIFTIRKVTVAIYVKKAKEVFQRKRKKQAIPLVGNAFIYSEAEKKEKNRKALWAKFV